MYNRMLSMFRAALVSLFHTCADVWNSVPTSEMEIVLQAQTSCLSSTVSYWEGGSSCSVQPMPEFGTPMEPTYPLTLFASAKCMGTVTITGLELLQAPPLLMDLALAAHL
jgi:hypothetical protein